MPKRIAVFLAPGFEEIEAVTVIDVLRRADFHVITAAVGTDDLFVTGAHGLTVTADCLVNELNPSNLIMTVCPGGLPGATNLASSEETINVIRAVYADGGWAAAICAAPIALHAAGILDGCKYTCYPSFEQKIGGAYTGARVETGHKIVTACGPGASIEFALKLVEVLGKEQTVSMLKQGMLVSNI